MGKKGSGVSFENVQNLFISSEDQAKIFSAREWRWASKSNDKVEVALMQLLVGALDENVFPCSLRKRNIITFNTRATEARFIPDYIQKVLDDTDITTKVNDTVPADDTDNIIGDAAVEYPLVSNYRDILKSLKSVQSLEYIWLSMSDVEKRVGPIYTICHYCNREVYFSSDGIRLRGSGDDTRTDLHMCCNVHRPQQLHNDDDKVNED